jgi:2-iminobutanoate/2-iminopropanoate deaminase
MKAINTNKSPKAVGPYSQAVLSNNTLYVSGQLHINPETGKLFTEGTIEEKTKIVMENIGNILKEAGMDFSNVVKASIFVKDLGNFAKINEIYGSYFKSGILPARETVQVAKLPLDGDVEISVIAVK